MMTSKNKKGQLTIFVIIAIVIVGLIILYFVLRNPLSSQIPENFQPVYDYYLSCIKEDTRQGVSLLGEQGGYIELPDFVPGNQYMPFSSQLDFLGQPVAYWMYASGNNVLREQVPSKIQMQEQLSTYVEDRLTGCDFSDFENQGFNVFIEKGDVQTEIKDSNVAVNVKNNLAISFDQQSVVVSNHEVDLSSKLGTFYNLAIQVYNFEKKNAFLEKYAVDVLRLYAPVDGVEITCAPKIVNEQEVKTQLQEALSENIAALKLKGNYYDISNKDNNYFVTDVGININENVNFIYSPDWTTRVEIYGDKIIEPVGLQQGLGILGFCYVPYHFVYDVNFPVLIQFYNNEEIFQFPISVVIDKNQERQAFYGNVGQDITSDVCKYKNQDVSVYTYDSELNPVEAKINFKCLNTECYIGNTEISGNNAILNEKFPSCVNGFILASNEGYADSKYQISTNEESSANIVLNKLYNISFVLESSSGEISNQALIRFESNDYSTVAVYPDTKTLQLQEAYYNVSVYVYKNSTVQFPGVTERKCVEIPKEGIAGVFGLTQEKCFEVQIPAQEVSYAVVGGGKTQEYLTEGQLKNSKQMKINIDMFKTPSSLEEVQQNYIQIEDSYIYIDLE